MSHPNTFEGTTAGSTEPSGVDVRPGQLWVWCFSVGDGTYFFEPVTEERRITFVPVGDVGIVTVRRGDSFIVVSTEDDGPAQPPNVPIIDEWGVMTSPAQPPKRWHVAMLHDTLVWIDHDCFNHAELIAG